MTASLRFLLVLCAFLVLFFVLRKLRKAQIQVMDSVFWIVLSFGFVVLALFPQIAYALSGLFGFESPSNLVFLCVVGILVVHSFSTTVQLAELRKKLISLIQEVGLENKDRGE